MLDLIRKKQKSIIVKVVFWAIIATFVGTIFLVWGKGSDQQQGDATVAATVNKTKIGFDEFQVAYQNIYRFYQNIYRDQLTPQVEKQLRLQQQALDMLIEQALLLEEGKRLDVEVSDQEVVQAISAVPAFQENGQFSKPRYLQVLSYQRMTPDQFESMQRRELLVGKVRSRLAGDAQVTDAELTEEYRRQNDKVNLAFVRMIPARFESQVRIDEAGLAAYFAAHREEFRLPDAVALDYVVLEPARFERDVTVDEAEIEKFYRRNLDRFEIPEQVKVAHILIQAPQQVGEAQRQQKRELAERVLREAKSGKDFAALARQYSQDPGSAGRGGDLGFFPRGTMVPEFERPAFALAPGQVSDLVETAFGFHIIKGEGHIEGRVKPLAEALDEVKSGLRQEKARQLAMEKAMDAYNLNRKEGSLAAAAKSLGLTRQQTGFFSREEAPEAFAAVPQVATAALTLKEGELGRPAETPQGVILFAVRERRASRLPELREVRARVEQAYRQEKAGELARQAAERILSGLRAGQSLASLVRAPAEAVEETGLFTRSGGGFVPRLGNSEALMQAAFTLTPESPAAKEPFAIDGTFVAAMLKERRPAEPAGLTAGNREELRKTILARKTEEAASARLKELREKANIVIAPALSEAGPESAKPEEEKK